MADETAQINIVASGEARERIAHFDCKVFSRLPKNAVGVLTGVVSDPSGKRLFRQDFGLWCYKEEWSKHHFEYPMGDHQFLNCEYTYFVQGQAYGPVVTTATIQSGTGRGCGN